MAKMLIKCRACGYIALSRKELTGHGKTVHFLRRGKRMAQTKKFAQAKLDSQRRYKAKDYPL